jgi:hypothetical protein
MADFRENKAFSWIARVASETSLNPLEYDLVHPPRIHHDHAESVLTGVDDDNLGVGGVHGGDLSFRSRASSIYPKKSEWTIAVSLFLERTPRSALVNCTAILFSGPINHCEPRAAFTQVPFATKPKNAPKRVCIYQNL